MNDVIALRIHRRKLTMYEVLVWVGTQFHGYLLPNGQTTQTRDEGIMCRRGAQVACRAHARLHMNREIKIYEA